MTRVTTSSNHGAVGLDSGITQGSGKRTLSASRPGPAIRQLVNRINSSQPNCPSARLHCGCTINSATSSTNRIGRQAKRTSTPATISSGHSTSAKIASISVRFAPRWNGSSMSLQLSAVIEQLGQTVHPQQKQPAADPQEKQPDVPGPFIPSRNVHGLPAQMKNHRHRCAGTRFDSAGAGREKLDVRALFARGLVSHGAP